MDYKGGGLSLVGRGVTLGALCAALSGCAAIGVALIGAGATAGASHHISGINYRTFTEPLPKVESATHAALKRMGITIESTEKVENLTVIKAFTAARNIEVQLELLTPQATRMRSVAYQSGGIIVDAATGGEIISQTELALTYNGNNGNGNNGNNAKQKPVAKRGA